MHRSPSRHGFTLIEMITVITIIAILAGLILSINGLVQRNAAKSRTETEIRMLTAALESYKADNGGYPQDSDSDLLNPRVSMSPSTALYQNASLTLYKALSGDANLNNTPPSTAKNYAPDFFRLSRFDSTYRTALQKNPNDAATKIAFIADPFGYSYGYSTGGLKIEQTFRTGIVTDPSYTRDKAKQDAKADGYNPTFDLWSTGGGTTSNDVPKWIKNW